MIVLYFNEKQLDGIIKEKPEWNKWRTTQNTMEIGD